MVCHTLILQKKVLALVQVAVKTGFYLMHCCELQRVHYGWMESQPRRFMLITKMYN